MNKLGVVGLGLIGILIGTSLSTCGDNVSQAERDEKTLDLVASAIEGKTSTILEKQFFDSIEQCKNHINNQISRAKALSPQIETQDLAPHMNVPGAYAMAMAETRSELFAFYCMPAQNERAAYFKAKLKQP